MEYQHLVKKAYEAQQFSYAPYSCFHVGAALLGENGKVYLGCNIENAAFSPTNCAERTAFFKAVSEGVTAFKAIAIVGNRAGATEEETDFCAPCGVCRQVMAEFCDPETFDIVLGKGDGQSQVWTLAQLLPLGFTGKEIE